MTNEKWESIKSEMKGMLIGAAKAKKTITYGRLNDLIGKPFNLSMSLDRKYLGKMLGEISKETSESGQGMLSVLAVNQSTGIPSRPFFELAYEFGRVGTDSKIFKEEKALVYGVNYV